MKFIKSHAHADFYPTLEGEEFKALVKDIEIHGLREKIWLYEGKVLDGRNRLRACQEVGVKPLTRNYRGNDPLGFVISMNGHRRHLTESQRAMVAAKIAALPKGAPGLNAPIGAFTQAKSAKQLKVGRRSVQRAKKVLKDGSKSLQKAVERGEVNVSKAAAVTDLPKKKQLKAAIASVPKDEPVDLGEFIDLKDIEDEQREYAERIDRVIEADDRLKQMAAELKRAAQEIVALKQARDRYMNQSCAKDNRLKAQDREIKALKAALAKHRVVAV